MYHIVVVVVTTTITTTVDIIMITYIITIVNIMTTKLSFFFLFFLSFKSNTKFNIHFVNSLLEQVVKHCQVFKNIGCNDRLRDCSHNAAPASQVLPVPLKTHRWCGSCKSVNKLFKASIRKKKKEKKKVKLIVASIFIIVIMYLVVIYTIAVIIVGNNNNNIVKHCYVC